METTLTTGSIDRFLRSIIANGAPGNTVRAYRGDLNLLLEWWAGQAATAPAPSPAISANDLEMAVSMYLNDCRQKNRYAPKTEQRKLGTFRSFAEWAGLPRLLPRYKTRQPAPSEPNPIDEGIPGVRAMIAATKPHQRHWRALVALTGLMTMRVHEAILVEPKHVHHDDPANREIRFVGKGGRERVVPISDEAWPYIEDAMETALIYGPGTTLVRLKDRQARNVITILSRRAALVAAASSHRMRATGATAAYENTKDIVAVQEILGHASLQPTRRYVRSSKKAKRAALTFA